MVPARLVISIADGPERARYWVAVAVFERIAAGVCMLLFAPSLLLLGAAVGVLSHRPPFIAHLRVGRYGRPLWVYKLRTMWPCPPPRRCLGPLEFVSDDRGPALKQPDDRRVTSRLARFCRRHAIDELPQLLNIAAGEMSFVGPRPVTAGELRAHYPNAAQELLTILPGLTGLWQCSGGSSLSYGERRILDLQYVRSRSLKTYITILIRTVGVVIRGADSW